MQVAVGDRVQAGALLAQLDIRQMTLQAQQARTALSMAEAQLAQLEAGPRQAEVAAAEADVQAATAQLDGALANLAQLKDGATDAQIAAAETQVAQAELQLKLAQLEFDKVNTTTDDEDKIEQLRRMATLCRDHTPDALFNPQSALRGAEYYWAPEDMGEDWVQEPYVMNHRRIELLKEFSDAFGHAHRGCRVRRSSLDASSGGPPSPRISPAPAR